MLLLTLQAALSTLLPGNCYHGMDFLAEINSTQSHEAQPHSLPARPLHQPGRGSADWVPVLARHVPGPGQPAADPGVFPVSRLQRSL